MTKHLSLALALALTTFAPFASAQSGRTRVSIERAFGITSNAVTQSVTSTVGSTTVTTESNTSWMSVNLFGAGYSSVGPGNLGLFPAAQVPRFAVDVEFDSHVTVGASAFISWNKVTDDASGSGTSVFGFGLAPRVGYVIPLTRTLTFWPRVGATLSYVSASPTSSSATTRVESTYVPVWINLEPTLAFALDSHVSLTLGLLGDLPIAGSATTTRTVTVGSTTSTTTTESTVSQLLISAQFGLMGQF